jgi:hypothetical protein
MKTLGPSIALPFIGEHPSAPNAITLEPTGGDMHVWGELEENIKRKANYYESLAELCRDKIIPMRATLGKLGYIGPVVYVKQCTGEPHFSRVSRILAFAGIEKNDKQLRIAWTAAEQKYPNLLRWMEFGAGTLTETAGYLRVSEGLR